MASATGLMAGPDNPPKTLAILGRLVFRFMDSPTSVLISDTASAPLSSHTCAISSMLPVLGESFTITGLVKTFLIPFIIVAIASLSDAN